MKEQLRQMAIQLEALIEQAQKDDEREALAYMDKALLNLFAAMDNTKQGQQESAAYLIHWYYKTIEG